MWMTSGEICREYQQPKDKVMQIDILADLNICSKAEIRDILSQQGIRVKATGRVYNTTWTADEEQLCVRLAKQGLYPAEIAKHIPKHDRRSVAKKMRALKCW